MHFPTESRIYPAKITGTSRIALNNEFARKYEMLLTENLSGTPIASVNINQWVSVDLRLGARVSLA